MRERTDPAKLADGVRVFRRSLGFARIYRRRSASLLMSWLPFGGSTPLILRYKHKIKLFKENETK